MFAGSRRQRNGSSPAALTTAVRAAARFDRSAVSGWGGLLATVPVVAVLGGGIAAGYPVAAVTMGAGAMLVGTAWRTGGGRPPLALLFTDAVLMATSTFVGCVTGSVPWLHLGVLCVWSLMGGLLVGVGNRGAVVGTQAIIAVVVFGRFSQPPAAALGLAALVLTGGCAQVLFLSIVRWPSPLRAQRAATAYAYRVLSDLAGAAPEASSLPAAAALDEAEATLSSPSLFGDSTGPDRDPHPAQTAPTARETRHRDVRSSNRSDSPPQLGGVGAGRRGDRGRSTGRGRACAARSPSE